MLGSIAALPANFSVSYWLGVTVGLADSEMTPRQPLVSAPYSLYAASAGCKPGDMISHLLQAAQLYLRPPEHL